MYKQILFFFLLSASFVGFSQDSLGYEWVKMKTYPVGEKEVWHVDILENYFVSEQGLMNKYDVDGNQLFSQSIKSLGQAKQFISINTSKLVHFSEDQQTLCYFDNTLSSMNDCIDLAEEGLVNATMVSASSQPNKIWVFDRFNSRLLLLALNRTNQQQEVLNISGTLDALNITQIKERGNRLFLVDPTKGVYIFDLYGSLIEFIPEVGVIQADGHEKALFTLHKDKLRIHFFGSNESEEITLPSSGITEFMYRNQHFFFRSANNVDKFELQFSE